MKLLRRKFLQLRRRAPGRLADHTGASLSVAPDYVHRPISGGWLVDVVARALTGATEKHFGSHS